MKLGNFAAISTLFISTYARSVDPLIQESAPASLQKRGFNPAAINLKAVTFFQCPNEEYYQVAYIKQVMKKACTEFFKCGSECASKYPMGFTSCEQGQFFCRSLENTYYRYPIFKNGAIFQNVVNARAGSDFVVFNHECTFAGVIRKLPCNGACRGTPQCVTAERKFVPNFRHDVCIPIVPRKPQRPQLLQDSQDPQDLQRPQNHQGPQRLQRPQQPQLPQQPHH